MKERIEERRRRREISRRGKGWEGGRDRRRKVIVDVK